MHACKAPRNNQVNLFFQVKVDNDQELVQSDLESKSPMILKLGMQQQGLKKKVYKVCIDNQSSLTFNS